jgi:release factor glutamine methyltransferase
LQRYLNKVNGVSLSQVQQPSIAQAIDAACSVLANVSDSAKLDSQLLLAFCLAKPISYLLTWPERTLTETQNRQFQQLVSERAKGYPVAYLVGEREFWSLALYVEPSTLIPRPDTEILVETALASFDEQPIRCLDLGTGTGAIALALASERSKWQIDAVDFSMEAVALAKRNAERHQLTHVAIYQSNWFEHVPEHATFDLIVSNPPYINPTDQHLALGDVRYEPLTALVSEANGLADIAHIITHAPHYLKDNGLLIVEHGYDQRLAVQSLFLQVGYHSIKTTKDYGGNDRITQAQFSHSVHRHSLKGIQS